MSKRLSDNMRNLYLPCIGLSVAAGVSSAIIITIFKICAEALIHFSGVIYGLVRENPVWLPLLILGAAVIGLLASFLYFLSNSSRGGGIPSSVAAIRGILSFRWLTCIIVLPFSAFMSFFCGLPLGTEGPCVQLGTAVGDGITKCLASKKQKGWRRYIMTGGASAGFSLAASSPVTAIIFAMEELHKRFSPLLMTVASISVMSAQITVQAFSSLGIGTVGLFHIPEIQAISPKLLFAPLIVGLASGFCSLLFSALYQRINKIIGFILKKISVKILFPMLFSSIALIGFFMTDSLGTGHSLIEKLFSLEIIWYFIILIFLVRSILMMLSNTAGVTGGVFLPTLSFGALLGSLLGQAMMALGWIDPSEYLLMVVLGIVAFLGATSHIPITASIFAIEALGGFTNVLSVIIAVTVSFLVVEIFDGNDFTDTVIEAKTRSIKIGNASEVEVSLTVSEDAFVIGKHLRDILWPNDCFVVSIERSHGHRKIHEIMEGDVITVRYKTYNPCLVTEELTVLMGKQSPEIEKLMTAC